MEFCESANLQDVTLPQFVKRCSPLAWKDFFLREYVLEAIGRTDDGIRPPLKEIDALQKESTRTQRV